VRERREEARARLAEILAGGERFDLVDAALWVAAEDYPEIDVAQEARRLGYIAGEGARRAYDLENPFARVDALRAFLFEELSFRGNEKEYNDPRNSYLNEVLDRRLGNPLTLSIVFLETARAAGFEAVGIGLPGHFVVGVAWHGRTILVDPYHGGRVISEEDCRQLVGRTTGRPSLFRRELLRGATERGMLTRMLLNLKHIYVKREDFHHALAVVERLLLVTPGDANELRDRGYLHAHLGLAGPAVEDLESYLARTPDASDADSIRGRVAWLRRRMTELN
jgi:regulator of sirC expression with transglutaminase-like and TPR domain